MRNVVCVLMMISFASTGWAKTFTATNNPADTNCNNPCYLQNALTAAASNNEADIVQLKPNTTYPIQLAFPFYYTPVATENFALTIQGAADGSSVIDAAAAGGYGANAALMLDVFNPFSASPSDQVNIVVDHVTMKNGVANQVNSAGAGGLVINARNSPVVLVKGCLVESTTSSSGGGGGMSVRSFGATAITLQGNTVKNNVGKKYGGGAYVTAPSGSITLQDNSFQNNTLTQNDGEGGGVYATALTVSLYDNVFSGNGAGSTTGRGGGAFVYASNGVSVTRFDDGSPGNTFVKNTVTGLGGGLYAQAFGPSTISWNTFGSLSSPLAAKNSAGANGEGGGFYVQVSQGGLALSNNALGGNIAGKNGGGGWVQTTAGVSLSDNVFKGNATGTMACQELGAGGVVTAQNCRGGGMFIVANNEVTSQNNVYLSNFGGQGAGLYGFVGASGFTSSKDNFQLNKNQDSTSNGGGLSVQAQMDAVVKEALFDGNTAANGGGGASLTSVGGKVAVSRSTFKKNEAVFGGGFSSGSNAELVNNFFFFNTGTYGGGVYLQLSQNGGKTQVLTNNTVINNSVNGYGGGVYLDSFIDAGSFTMANNLVFGNAGSLGGKDVYLSDDRDENKVGSPAHLLNNYYTDLGSACVAQGCTPAVTLTANIVSTTKPGFVDPNPGTTNPHISQLASPVINAGSVNAPALPTGDIDGQARDAIPDIGADEVIVPNLIVAPSAHDFAGVLIGSSSSAQALTLSNVGNLALDLNQVSFDGDVADFALALAESSCGGFPRVLAPGESCGIDVRFQPSTAGAKTAMVAIASNDPDTPVFQVGLSGNGVVPEEVVIADDPTTVPGATGGPAAQQGESTADGASTADGTTESAGITNAELPKRGGCGCRSQAQDAWATLLISICVLVLRAGFLRSWRAGSAARWSDLL